MKKFIILIPLYNDWKSVSKLLDEIDLQTISWDAEASVIIVNDASTESRPEMRSEIMHEESIQKSLMPGMEQKHLLEERVSEERYERPIIIKVKKNDYNLSLAILLVVLLIGFIYQTRD